MNKLVVKVMGVMIVSILILALTSIVNFKNFPSEIYTHKDTQSVMTTIPKVGLFNSLQYDKDKLDINFFGLIPIKTISLHEVEDIEVIPGGTSIGVKLSSEGVLVVGFSDINVNQQKIQSPAKDAGIEVGDIILEANGNKIENSKDLVKNISVMKSEIIDLTIKRETEIINKKFKLIKENDNKYKIGLWVRDSTAGVGTLTFYHKESGKFGALGHPVTDVDTNKSFSINQGELVEASIISIRKGEKGIPGELRGIFVDCNNPLGGITKNTQCGIFGNYTDTSCKNMRNEKMKVGFRNEIKLGKATIITTIDEQGPKEYGIEILKLSEQSEPGSKSMLIKVTDQELLAKTGGIVQGMSGSPIIQNGKVIGAVTHVLINKPDVGYGIYIDWMLKEAGIIR